MVGAVPSIRIEQAVAIVGGKGKGGFARAKAPKTRKSRHPRGGHDVCGLCARRTCGGYQGAGQGAGI